MRNSVSTVVKIEGYETRWNIVTMKRYKGELATTAQRLEGDKGITFMMFSDPSVTLISEKVARVTQKAMQSQHEKALEIFKTHPEIIAASTAISENTYKVGIGSIVWGEYAGCHLVKYVVVDKVDSDYGDYFIGINPDGMTKTHLEHIRPYSEKFGIGLYYNDNEMYEGDVVELYNEAKRIQAERDKAEEEAEALAQKEYKEKVAKGKELLTIPSDAKAIIVADMWVDSSDGMTDYFHASADESQRVLLGFSKTTRNNLNELKKYVQLFQPELEGFEDMEQRNKGGYYVPEYYLGSEFWSGWKVRKLRIGSNFDRLYHMAGDGRSKVAQNTPSEANSGVVIDDLIVLHDYSEKAIAVTGDTKDIKEELKELGGRFNPRLKCGPGWIFSKKKEEAVRSYLKI